MAGLCTLYWRAILLGSGIEISRGFCGLTKASREQKKVGDNYYNTWVVRDGRSRVWHGRGERGTTSGAIAPALASGVRLDIGPKSVAGNSQYTLFSVSTFLKSRNISIFNNSSDASKQV